MKTEKYQEGFFDEHPGFYPWPDLLIEMGFAKSFKLRDVKFKKYLDLLGIKKDDKVLDVGCGEGIFLARVAKTYEVDGTGVDISKKSIATAKSLRLRSGQAYRLRFQVADATKLPFPNESFNHVLSFDALEHVRGQSKALSEMVRVLAPGGSLLVYTLNRNQRYTWNLLLDKLGVDVYKRVDHDPSLFLEPRWVKKELERMGIGVERLELYGSFFTLALDEAIMLFILCLKRLGFWSPASCKKIAVGRIFLNLADFFSRFLLVPLEVLEIPWKKAGYSNSFFVLGRKR
jgi:SAM-dependent methyltransferase